MTKAETEFNEILTSLKEYLEKPIAPEKDSQWSKLSIYALGYREQDPFRDLLFKNQIKIMESGIFHKGGLKGKVLPVSGRGTHHKVWLISNLGELLAKLTSIMTVSAEPDKNVKEFVSGYFDNLLKAFDKTAPLARLGGVRKPTLEKMRTDLEGWKKKTIKKIPAFKKKTALEIAETLIPHLPPQTPYLTIAERANELLAAFDKEGITANTLRKTVAKMRENQTQKA